MGDLSNNTVNRAPTRRKECGAALLILLLISVAIIGVLAAMAANQISRAVKDKELAQLQTIGVKCKRAMEMVKESMDVEYKLRCSYPYKFDDDFLDRFKTIDRWIFNSEIWHSDAGSELELNTFFGETYELTGWCRDGFVYHYDSKSDTTAFERYSRRDLAPEEDVE